MQGLTSRQAALWIQPGGPNTIPYFLGCHELGDLTEPKGGISLTRRFKPDGSGWETVASTQAPPDPVSTSVQTILQAQRDWIEKVGCPFTLFVMHRDCGPADVFSNWIRGQIIKNVRLTQRSYTDMETREEEKASMVGVEMEGEPPLIDVDRVEVARIGTAEVNAFNAISANTDMQCYGPCGANKDFGDHVVLGADGGAAATPNAYWSIDGLTTHTAFAADPFIVVNENVASIVKFPLGRGTWRILAAKIFTGAGQGKTAVSDDNGATWTITNVGGAAAAHGPTIGQKGLCVWSRSLILMASNVGYIYRSTDGGATWTAVDAGGIHVNPWNAVHMSDEMNAIAVGGGVDIVGVSDDGGLHWAAPAANPASGAALNTCWMIDANRWWVGSANGRLYYTSNGGVTWSRRQGWTGEGIGQVRDIYFVDELMGYMIVDTAAPLGTVLRTIDGGYTWDALLTPANSGLNSLWMSKSNLGYAVGEPNAATGVILQISS